MQTDKFRLVIVGAGAISRAAHVPAALASPFVDLVGVIDPDINRAKELCRDYGIDISIGASIDQLGVSFDGAIVATPNDLHASIAKSLVENNIPVLVEKPMATELAAAQELTSLANSKGVLVAVGYHTRQSGACQTLKRVIDSQHFGRALSFAHQDGSRGGWSPLSAYNLNSQRAGGGVLVTTGTHFLDRIIWLWGTPDSISLQDNAAGGPESHCIARFEFSSKGSKITGSAIFSKVVSLPESTVVQTTDGLLIMRSDAAETIIFRPKRDFSLEYEVKPYGNQPDPRSLYQRELEDFVAACKTRTQPSVNAAAGLKSVELVSHLYAGRKSLSETTAPTSRLPERPRAPLGRIAIIGASGFVGSSLTEYLLDNTDYSVTPFVHSSGGATSLAHKGLVAQRLDLLDRDNVESALRGFDYVVNCSRGGQKVMIDGLDNLLRASLKAGVKKLVHLSSVAIYGDPPDPLSTCEDAPTAPLPGSYGAIKLLQDEKVQQSVSKGLNAVILCPPNITGRYSDYLTGIINSIESGRFRLIDGGCHPVNIVDVFNLSACIASALVSNINDGRRLFVCEPANITWQELCAELMPVVRGEREISSVEAEVLGLAPISGHGVVKSRFRGVIKHLMSDEVRTALRVHPAWALLETKAKGSVHVLGAGAEDYLRNIFNGPTKVALAKRGELLDTNLIAQQLRKVKHDPSRCHNELAFQPPLSFAESMQSFREWYRTYLDADSPEWQLLGEAAT